MASDIKEQINHLRDEIRRHDYLYYVKAMPEISDYDYDLLMRQLRELEEKNPDLITPESPTQRIGDKPAEGFERVRHSVAMLSIDNTYNLNDLREFHQRVLKGLGTGKVDYVVDPKIDGVAVSIRYENGIFTRAVSRGDGEVGDDITQNIKTIKTIPLQLSGSGFPEILEVRGEVYWPRKGFAEYNRKREEAGEQKLANPRNATAGTLKQLDSRIAAERGLAFYCHGFGEVRPLPTDSHFELAGKVEDWGVPANPHMLKINNFDELIGIIEAWNEKRAELEYQTDGMVIKVDSFSLREELGFTARSPRWCIAYKYEAEQAVTKLENVRWQVGKLGTLTPVADLEPVWIAGTTVSHASLHNIEQIRKLDLRIGDTVVIEKAGEIIPQVVSVSKDNPRGTMEISQPAECPVCGGEVKQDEDGVAIRCLNANCPAQFKEKLRFFASRDMMDIDGLGPAIIEQLVDNKTVCEYADLYKLTQANLSSLERMGKKSAENLIKAIEASKSRDLPHFIAALNIPNVGLTTAEILAKEFKSIDALTEAGVEQLENLPDIGPIVAKSVYDYFNNPINIETIKHLKEEGVNMQLTGENLPEAKQIFAGQTLVVTGTLQHYSRSEIESLIKKLGGRAASSVSAKTDFLIAGANPGSKVKKAEEAGVKIISEQKFIEMLK